MKIQETPEGVRISIHAPLRQVLSIVVRGGPGERVWDVLHSSFKPVEQPVVSIHPETGQSVEGIVLQVTSIHRTPMSELVPDPENTPDDSYTTHIVIGDVPAGYRQEFPGPGTPLQFHSGRRYFVRVWSTQKTEEAVFTKQ